MASPISSPRSSWLAMLLLLAYTSLVRASATLMIEDTNTTVAVNFPPNSDDVNLFFSSPDWFQYTSIGFGDSMSAGAYMLIAYASDKPGEVTVSPRLTIQTHHEPYYTESNDITIHPSTAIVEHMMLVNLTCHGCRSYLQRYPADAPPFIFAMGPGRPLSSSSRDAFLRRHIAHGVFTVDAAKATGPGGVSVNARADGAVVTDGAVLVDGRAKPTGKGKGSVAHGVVFTIVALAVMPVDAMIAGTLGRRYPKLHAVTGTVVVAMVVAGLVVGLGISSVHRSTANSQTPHQILGLLVTGLIFALWLLGVGLAVIKKRFSSNATQQEPQVGADGSALPPRPEQGTGLIGSIHRWTGRLVWVLMIVSGGLGLQLAERGKLFMMGYGVLVGAVFLVLMPVWFCIWRWQKHRKEKAEEQEYELQHQGQYNMYNHDRY